MACCRAADHQAEYEELREPAEAGEAPASPSAPPPPRPGASGAGVPPPEAACPAALRCVAVAYRGARRPLVCQRFPVAGFAELRERLGSDAIVACRELRHHLPGASACPLAQPRALHHAFTLLEVVGAVDTFELCLERFGEELEVMFGTSRTMRPYARRFRATGEERGESWMRPITEQPRSPVGPEAGLPRVTVSGLCHWLEGLLAAWPPFSAAGANSQHFSLALQAFLTAPGEQCPPGDAREPPPAAGVPEALVQGRPGPEADAE
ncbi:unnamed protein product, partial [Prorocentrum cordatum]